MNNTKWLLFGYNFVKTFLTLLHGYFCWRRDTIKGGDVLSKIAEEVDDKKAEETAAETSRLQGVGRPDRSTDVHNVHRGRAVDRSGRPL